MCFGCAELSNSVCAATQEQRNGWSERVEPFRVIGNIYYVGAKGLSSYLVTTPEGHILLDTGINEMHDVIRTNIENLGFKLEDVKFMVSSHAHWDHIEGHAAHEESDGCAGCRPRRRRRGARIGPGQLCARGGRLGACRGRSGGGGRGHAHARWDDVAGGVDGWSYPGADDVDDDRAGGGADVRRCFRGGEIPNAGAPLVDNPRHPTVVEDTQRTLRLLKELEPPDLFLHNHPRDTYPELNPDLPVNPNCASCLDAEGWTEMVARLEASFQLRLTEP